MKITDMQVDAELIDRTQLDDAEQMKILELLSVYSETLVHLAMTKGVAAALQLAAGAALRMVKASQGVVPATLEDLKRATNA